MLRVASCELRVTRAEGGGRKKKEKSGGEDDAGGRGAVCGLHADEVDARALAPEVKGDCGPRVGDSELTAEAALRVVDADGCGRVVEWSGGQVNEKRGAEGVGRGRKGRGPGEVRPAFCDADPAQSIEPAIM